MKSQIAVTTVRKQKIVAEPFFIAQYLLLRIVSGVVQKDLVKKVLVTALFGGDQVERH